MTVSKLHCYGIKITPLRLHIIYNEPKKIIKREFMRKLAESVTALNGCTGQAWLADSLGTLNCFTSASNIRKKPRARLRLLKGDYYCNLRPTA